MKQMNAYNRFLCVFMSLMLLLSSTGLAINEHFCTIQKKSSFSLNNSESCEMDRMSEKSCCNSNQSTSCTISIDNPDDDKDCCIIELRFLSKLEQQYLLSQLQNNLNDIELTAKVLFYHSKLFCVDSKSESNSIADKGPPQLTNRNHQNLSVLQCFRC